MAAELLKEEGYEIVKQNYYCRYGEIDLICRKEGRLVFTEVKTRRSLNFGRPAEAVTWEKVLHMKRAAMEYMMEQQVMEDFDFMVVEIYINVMKHFI